ncbi:MAG TPA: type I 3-dehydroquinate dehydratase [Planctomycetota bacterium]|jgi:3-dehydroquinate dehydratase type I|nr:type I 3-dehydroquinate dehydratase [Planctomycetota bacterium]OQC22192.1 MAG: 3-dehydroquinate dehydratase [Planctomycetes bacterium ADurb.Bin069]NMD34530.1 type I 3-dehydroquinate dehydratase [Planctomycetota bacterium]HNS00036.1 type I 3-dehydroquinate dehydratase [Planctomycetota bacterium]HNU25375.1 type I 3-dehydroquinate dehydratase [Planctomycetota bacterium]
MIDTLRSGIAVTATGPFDPDAVQAADYCEIRADLWPGGPAEALTQIAASPRPVIFTCRTAHEGGGFRGPESERAAIFARACELGALLVDIELRSTLFRRGAAEGWPVLASLHDFTGPIEGLTDLLRGVRDDGATAAKLVPTARSIRDLAVLRRALAAPAPLPAALFAMGPCGIASRILALTWGSLLSYTAAEAPAAPGQLTLALYTQVYGDRRAFPAHIALAGAGHDLWPAARVANRLCAQNNLATRAVPYPSATPDDFPVMLDDLGAQAVVGIGGTPGAGWRCALHRARRQPSEHPAATLDAALASALGALGAEEGEIP